MTESTVETFDMVSLAAVFADMMECFGVEDRIVSAPEIHIGLSIEVAVGEALPEADSTFVISAANVTPDDFSCLAVLC